MSEKFPRQNWFRAKKLGKEWRRVKGSTSKIRKCNIGRPAKPRIGYGSPAAEKFSINGETPNIVSCLKDMENCTSIILSSRLGLKSVLVIAKEADKKGIKILNRKKIIKAEKVALRIKKTKEAKKALKKEISKPSEEAQLSVANAPEQKKSEQQQTETSASENETIAKEREPEKTSEPKRTRRRTK
ncbi:MAG: hypothetical protein HZB65_02830 [Candidatus Aenigmarchaeota archaeon]|nr:hypothetical protein [Candidatus Aenigmarchaeota archaeon]